MNKIKADGKLKANQKQPAKPSAKASVAGTASKGVGVKSAAGKPAKPKAAATPSPTTVSKASGASSAAARKPVSGDKGVKSKTSVKASGKTAAPTKKTPVQKKVSQKTSRQKSSAKKLASSKPASHKQSSARAKTEQSKTPRAATKSAQPVSPAPKRAAPAARSATAVKSTSTAPAETASKTKATQAASVKADAPKAKASPKEPAAKKAQKPAKPQADDAGSPNVVAAAPDAAPTAKAKSKSSAKAGSKAASEAKGAADAPLVVRPKLNVGQKPRVERSESEIAQLVVPAATVARTEELAANAVKASPAAKEAKLAFKVNDHIVYPAHGVGRITGIEKQHIAGITNELFVIDFEQEKMKLRVPTSKAAAVGMRGLSDEAQVNKAVDMLKGRARVKRTMWSRRAQEYEAKINSGDIIAVAEVVRDLYRATDQPEQSYSERQLFEAALDRLAREVSAVRKKDLAATLSDLEASLQQKRAAA